VRIRYLVVALLAYVAADFANPLMPGAVRFTAGTIETINAHRTGTSEIAVADVGAVVSRRLEPEELVELRPVLADVPDVRPQWLLPLRRPTSRAAKQPSPPDDH
jgi:hypothetical protein